MHFLPSSVGSFGFWDLTKSGQVLLALRKYPTFILNNRLDVDFSFGFLTLQGHNATSLLVPVHIHKNSRARCIGSYPKSLLAFHSDVGYVYGNLQIYVQYIYIYVRIHTTSCYMYFDCGTGCCCPPMVRWRMVGISDFWWKASLFTINDIQGGNWPVDFVWLQ